MSRLALIISLICSLAGGGCAEPATAPRGPHAQESSQIDRSHRVKPFLEPAYWLGFDFQKLGPQEFIDFLSTYHEPVYLIQEYHYGWIRPDDVPRLVGLLEDKTSCARVVRSIGAGYPTDRSTVQAEALFLLQGFRKGEYPPKPYVSFGREDIDEMQRWFREWTATR